MCSKCKYASRIQTVHKHICSLLTNLTLHVRVMLTTVANVSLYAVQFSAVFVKLVEKSWVLLYSFI